MKGKRMDRMEAEDFSLSGLLGRSWELDAAVVDVMFDQSEGAVAFTLADGSVAVARVKDSEPAAKRIRISAEDGRSSILPRTKPLPPIPRFSAQKGTPVAITTYGKHGFVIGDASGALTSVTIGGERTPFAPSLNAPISTLDHAAETGQVATAIGNQVALVSRGDGVPLLLDHNSSINAVRFSPRGDVLAVACEQALVFWAAADGHINGQDVTRTGEIPISNTPLAMVWSLDQSRLAIGFENGGVGVFRPGDSEPTILADYPSPVRAIAWSPKGDIMVTSGAFRVIAWPLDDMETNGAAPASLETGKPSLVAVESIAAHPKRPLVAAGYENGMLIIAELGKRDELVIKTEGGGAVTGMAWSSDGGYLAFGSGQGQAAIIELPSQLFK